MEVLPRGARVERIGDDDAVGAKDRDRHPQPCPARDPLAEPEVREEDRDERLGLLQEQGLDEVPVAEADGEQDRGQGRGADADRDDRPPLGRVE